jgi:hypothetical protein
VPRKYTAEEREARARPGYHDLTDGGDMSPARSALTLRLVLASFGVVVCGAASAAFVVEGYPDVLAALLAFLGAVALVDIIVIARRKLRGEPG